jgi:hypothetical protein
LECHSFGPDLETFLEKLFKLGHPHHTVSTGFCEPTVSTESLPRRPAPNSSFQIAAEDQPHASQRKHLRSYASQRHPGPTTIDNNPNGPVANELKRNSVIMLDAPSIAHNGTGEQHHDQPLAFRDNELLDVQGFLNSSSSSINETLPLPKIPVEGAIDPFDDPSKVSPRRIFMRKSKELLSRKKSQPFQRCVADQHPDLPMNYRVSNSRHVKHNTAVAAIAGINGIYYSPSNML